MGSAITELQREALDPTITVTNLLRKALVVAKKLGIAEFEAWITKELNGYPDNEGFPDYRQMAGRVEGLNRYHGWLPVEFGNSELEALFLKRPLMYSVAEIENLLASQFTEFQMAYSPAITRRLREMTGFDIPFAFTVHKSSLVKVLDRIRSTVLNWALQLEKDGVVGDDFSFTESEQNTTTNPVYSNINNFYGDVAGTQIQQGTTDSIQMRDLVIDDVKKFVVTLKAELPKIDLGEDARTDVEVDLATVESQLQRSKPKRDVLKSCLSSIKAILEAAGGTVAGELIAKLAGLGV